MSLKALELQVALPRTQEVSRIQEQQQQRHTHEQQVLIEDRKQFDELTRHRATNINESTGGQIKEKQEEEKKKQQTKNQKTQQNKQEAKESQSNQKEFRPAQSAVQMTDPLRGHFIDVSL